MTGLTAKTFGLKDRGLVKEATRRTSRSSTPAGIDEAATFERPIQAARGIDMVIVNGTPVWRDGKHPRREARKGVEENMKTYRIAAIGGDGIGPEVIEAGIECSPRSPRRPAPTPSSSSACPGARSIT
jgi:hypothetical protein